MKREDPETDFTPKILSKKENTLSGNDLRVVRQSLFSHLVDDSFNAGRCWVRDSSSSTVRPWTWMSWSSWPSW